MLEERCRAHEVVTGPMRRHVTPAANALFEQLHLNRRQVGHLEFLPEPGVIDAVPRARYRGGTMVVTACSL